MSDQIPIARPTLGPEEAAAAEETILSGWVTQGPKVAQFEKDFANYVGSRFAVAVSNCTVALHLALKAVGVQSGDQVIAPSHSFIASANSILYCGATPVFVDIEENGFNMDPAKVKEAISSATKAILVVHQVGMPAAMEAILEIANEAGLPVVEDAACAIGSAIQMGHGWEKIGRPHGDVACFSFHPRKVITTGDGGMLTTNSPEWDAKFRLWRQHGMNISDVVRHGSQRVVFEEYSEVGYNYRMTDIQAAIGSVQLGRLDSLIEERRKLAHRYQELLADVSQLSRPVEPTWARSNWQTYMVTLLSSETPQYDVMQQLLEQGISTRRGIMCAHREPAYEEANWMCSSVGGCTCEPRSCRRLSRSEQAQDLSIALPLFPGMSEAQQDRVVSALKIALQISMDEGEMNRASTPR